MYIEIKKKTRERYFFLDFSEKPDVKADKALF